LANEKNTEIDLSTLQNNFYFITITVAGLAYCTTLLGDCYRQRTKILVTQV